MLFAIGQKVKIKKNLSIHKTYYDITKTNYNIAIHEMLKFSGRIVTITHYSFGQYHIKEDKGMFFWIDEMFDLEFNNKMTFKDFIEINQNQKT